VGKKLRGIAMLNEYGFDLTAPAADYGKVVVAVLPHPLHGRLVERPILYVRPGFSLKGERYKLTWWSDGVAYYEPSVV
jgi:hypothetical protein